MTTHERIEVLLEEYRALNALLLYRLEALDRRLPVTGGFIAASVAGVTTAPTESKLAILALIPIVLFWLVHTTVTHAQSKEDHLRRIDEIEQEVNELAGHSLMVFQSRHPNLGKVPAGRSGHATVTTLSLGSIVVLAICLLLVHQKEPTSVLAVYALYVVVVMWGILAKTKDLSCYGYQKQGPTVWTARQPKEGSHL